MIIYIYVLIYTSNITNFNPSSVSRSPPFAKLKSVTVINPNRGGQEEASSNLQFSL